jgi:hypothetical protein
MSPAEIREASYAALCERRATLTAGRDVYSLGNPSAEMRAINTRLVQMMKARIAEHEA